MRQLLPARSEFVSTFGFYSVQKIGFGYANKYHSPIPSVKNNKILEKNIFYVIRQRIENTVNSLYQHLLLAIITLVDVAIFNYEIKWTGLFPNWLFAGGYAIMTVLVYIYGGKIVSSWKIMHLIWKFEISPTISIFSKIFFNHMKELVESEVVESEVSEPNPDF